MEIKREHQELKKKNSGVLISFSFWIKIGLKLLQERHAQHISL